ncbi:MAG: MBL fold metallo-hydrolase [Eubacterium sp.]|nr:MBL fold metallo-hydrolase [Eubacterium sp.]
MYKMSSVTIGPVATNCYTIINEESKEAILIDVSGNPERLLAAVKEAGAKPVALLLTHAHFDHMDATDAVRAKYPDIEVIIGENDAPLLENPSLNLSYGFMGEPVSVKADRTVYDGEELELIGIRIKCIEVPGHTIGGMCYYMPDLTSLFDGDTLFHGSIGRSDFPTGDGDALIENIATKLFVLPSDTRVFPGHDSETTIGWEKSNNPYF